MSNAKPPKTVEIIVDGTPFDWEKGDKISYVEVVTIAYPDYANNPNITYSVTYELGHGSNPEGVLVLGGSVKVHKGMEFRVSRTGES